MRPAARAVLAAGRAVWALLVDDGAVAAGILIAVALTAALSIPALLGHSDATGWALFTLVWGALAVSLHRAAAPRRPGQDQIRPDR